MRIGRAFLLFVSTLMTISVVAQNIQCPTNVILAMSRAGSACSQVGRNQICYGNGVVETVFDSDDTLLQPGSIADLTYLRAVNVISNRENNEWSVATLLLQADLIDIQQRSVMALLYGDVKITNLSPVIPHLSVNTIGAVNIRIAPQVDAHILEQVGVNRELIANGHTSDGRWLRVFVPNQNGLGWVSTDVVSSPVGFATLVIVDETTPFYRPFQLMAVQTNAGDALCEGAPESGVLLQTPSTFVPVEFVINNTILRLAGTAYLQTIDAEMFVYILDGEADLEIEERIVYVPAGSYSHSTNEDDEKQIIASISNPEGYQQSTLSILPINNLATRFSIASTLTQAEILQLTEARDQPEPINISSNSQTENNQCQRKVTYITNALAGPGPFYEVMGIIQTGQSIIPAFQVIGTDGKAWWQLQNGSWIATEFTESSGNCQEVPLTQNVRAPRTNHLSLETCETTNGPLRAGQRVTIEFVPPAWETLAEARQASTVDPGKIVVGSLWVYTRASTPTKVAEERFVRTFSATWTATAGTHRIVGQRLSYKLICSVTVPTGSNP